MDKKIDQNIIILLFFHLVFFQTLSCLERVFFLLYAFGQRKRKGKEDVINLKEK